MMPVVLAVALALGLPLSGADLEREARVLDAMLIAPCCFTQQVSVHQSPAATEVRNDVRARLAAGQTRQQVLDAYVAQYGKRILVQPPAEGFDLTLYVAPVAVFVASVIFVGAAVRRLTRDEGDAVAETETAAGPVSDVDGDLDAKLDDELRDLD